MSKFLIGIIAFFLPVVALYAFPFAIFWQAREFTSLDTIIKTQGGPSEAIYAGAYHDILRNYKLRMVAARNPDVIALGNSLVVEFRKDFFSDRYTFVNAGGAAPNMDHAIAFMRALPNDGKRRVVIFSLSKLQFTNKTNESENAEPVTLASRLYIFFTGEWKSPYVDLFYAHKFTLPDLWRNAKAHPFIGLNALVNHEGFLNDGSFYYAREINNSSHVDDLQALYKAQLAYLQTQAAAVTSAGAWDEQFAKLETFLDLCKARHVYVVGFFPPDNYMVSKKIDEPLDENGEFSRSVFPRVHDIFSRYGYPTFNYMNTNTVKIRSTEFVDLIHPTDKADLRMLIDMANHDRVLGGFVDASKLKTLLSAAKGDFIRTELP